VVARALRDGIIVTFARTLLQRLFLGYQCNAGEAGSVLQVVRG
jgi:hypothetical protein